MRVSYGLPTHHVDVPALVSAPVVGRLASAAEEAGFDAVYVTEHPFPADQWLAEGGHHALDPMVTLAFAAAATGHIRLHTNLFVAAYRNPFLAAKAISTLDVLSGGRVMLGIGSGYLEGEFAALGASFEDRNDRTDEAIVAMKAAWLGQPVRLLGGAFEAAGNTMLPRPVQRPHPPIWIGGNSRRAIRRAVEHGDGWSPFPTSTSSARRNRTARLSSADDLSAGIAYAAEHAERIGRSAPLEVAYVPPGLRMGEDAVIDPAEVIAGCEALAAIGVGWVVVAFPGRTEAAQLRALGLFGEAVLPSIRGL